MIVKVCGLTRVEDALWAEKCGADVLGFIYGVAQSPRNNSLDQMAQLVLAHRGAQQAVLMRNPTLQNISDILSVVKPQIFHLCGQEDSHLRDAIKHRAPDVQLWQTIGVPIDQPKSEHWKYQLDECWSDSALTRVVLDSAKSGLSGGTGCVFPHLAVANHLGPDCKKVLIAGGINPDNIEAILKIASWAGVDVSSGLEHQKGEKDADKVKLFFNKLNEAVR